MVFDTKGEANCSRRTIGQLYPWTKTSTEVTLRVTVKELRAVVCRAPGKTHEQNPPQKKMEIIHLKDLFKEWMGCINRSSRHLILVHDVHPCGDSALPWGRIHWFPRTNRQKLDAHFEAQRGCSFIFHLNCQQMLPPHSSDSLSNQELELSCQFVMSVCGLCQT